MKTAILHLTKVGQIVGNFLRGITKMTEHRENITRGSIQTSSRECCASALVIGVEGIII